MNSLFLIHPAVLQQCEEFSSPFIFIAHIFAGTFLLQEKYSDWRKKYLFEAF